MIETPHEDLFDFELVRPRRVCLCMNVTEEMIRDAIRLNGARSFREVQALTRCSTGCGTCEGRVKDVMKKYL